MKIEVGKKYLTRDGRFVVEIIRDDKAPYMPMQGVVSLRYGIDSQPGDSNYEGAGGYDCWGRAGEYFLSSEDALDLVSEYTDPPHETQETNP